MRSPPFIFTAIALLNLAVLPWTGSVEAARGTWITRAQERSVELGMDRSEVLASLGRPQEVVSYRSAAGPTWTYGVTDPVFAVTVFDVEFGSDGKVKSCGERVVGRE